MSPEHKFTLWVACLTALPTLALAAMVAFWTWWRDQERVIVQKSPVYWQTLDPTVDVPPSGVGIVVRNLSLFPVRIAGLFFQISKNHFVALDRDEHKEEWPFEVATHAQMVIYANHTEWKKLEAFGATEKIMDWSFVAIARTETGTRFSSNRTIVNVLRPFRALLRRFPKMKKRSK